MYYVQDTYLSNIYSFFCEVAFLFDEFFVTNKRRIKGKNSLGYITRKVTVSEYCNNWHTDTVCCRHGRVKHFRVRLVFGCVTIVCQF